MVEMITTKTDEEVKEGQTIEHGKSFGVEKYIKHMR